MSTKHSLIIIAISWLCQFLFPYLAQAQVSTVDTLYIEFDADHPYMKKEGYLMKREGYDPMPQIRFTIIKPEYSEHDAPRFLHYPVTKEVLEAGMGKDLPIYIKDSSFLRSIKPLTYEWFKSRKLGEISSFFGEKSKNPPLIFIIDEDDMKDCKLKLIQVVYYNPVNIK